MAVLFESSSPIEFLLKDALMQEGISFQEQYRVYENYNNLMPKYVVDFLVLNGQKRIVVECDGSSWHSSDYDAKKTVERDNWLKQHGYNIVLHFTSYQIKYEMQTVIATIKHYLGIEKVSKSKRAFKGKRNRTTYIINVPNASLHSVQLHYVSMQLQDKVWIVYKYQDETLNRFSEERIRLFCNVPDKTGNALAVYIALLDLKRSVNLLVHCHSEWLTAYLNRMTKTKQESLLMLQIEKILLQHNYLFTYLNMRRNPSYYDMPSDARLIGNELLSRCRQVRYGKSEKYSDLPVCDYNSVFKT